MPSPLSQDYSAPSYSFDGDDLNNLEPFAETLPHPAISRPVPLSFPEQNDTDSSPYYSEYCGDSVPPSPGSVTDPNFSSGDNILLPPIRYSSQPPPRSFGRSDSRGSRSTPSSSGNQALIHVLNRKLESKIQTLEKEKKQLERKQLEAERERDEVLKVNGKLTDENKELRLVINCKE